jgi:TonB family protein
VRPSRRRPSSRLPPPVDPSPPEAAGAVAARHDAARISFLRLLEKRKTYLGRARNKGIQGSVALSVTLDAAGRARQLAVSHSSGSTILDDAALDLVRRSLPFAHGLGVPFKTDITIAYRLSPK